MLNRWQTRVLDLKHRGTSPGYDLVWRRENQPSLPRQRASVITMSKAHISAADPRQFSIDFAATDDTPALVFRAKTPAAAKTWVAGIKAAQEQTALARPLS